MPNHYLLSKRDLSEDMQCTELSPLIEALRDGNKHFVMNNERPADMNVEEVMEVYMSFHWLCWALDWARPL